MSSKYRVGQKVQVINLTSNDDGGRNLTIGKIYTILEVVDCNTTLYPIRIEADDCGNPWWLVADTFEVVSEPEDVTDNPFAFIQGKHLTHLLDLAGQLVAAYDDCDEGTKQLLGVFMVKIGGIEVKR